MRRFATAAITSGALVAGLTATVPPALASTSSPAPGVADTAVRQGTVPARSVLDQAKREGKPYSAKETTAIARSVACRWYERTEGLKNSRNGHWLIYVQDRLTWCYDGLNVLSARANYNVYSYNNRVFRWRGWAKKSLTHTNTWSSVTTEAQGRFYYSGNRRTYQPWIITLGAFNGSYRSWWGV
jgi:hypothetical protein